MVKFAQAAREKVRRAAELAEAEQASMVEVEHLLAAVVDPATDSVGRSLRAAGISPDTIREARDREFRSALALVGVHTDRPSPAGSARQRRGRQTKFAPSSKLALDRTLEIAATSGERRITTKSLALAMLATDVGIMPRLLRELGTSREQLEHLLRNEA